MDFGKRSILGLRYAVDDEQHAQETEAGVNEKSPTRSDEFIHRASQTRHEPDEYPVGGYGHAGPHRLELKKKKSKKKQCYEILINPECESRALCKNI